MVSPIKIYSLSHLYLAKEAATNTFIHSLIYTSPKGRRQTHLLKTMMFLIIIFIIPQNMPHVKRYLNIHCINFLWETPLLIFTHTLFYLVSFLYCCAFLFFRFQMYMFLLLQHLFLYFLLLFYHIFLVLY